MILKLYENLPLVYIFVFIQPAMEDSLDISDCTSWLEVPYAVLYSSGALENVKVCTYYCTSWKGVLSALLYCTGLLENVYIFVIILVRFFCCTAGNVHRKNYYLNKHVNKKERTLQYLVF